MPPYIAPYRGTNRGLPPGYMQAATMPGNAIGQGIASMGQSLADAVDAVTERHRREGDLAKAAGYLFKAVGEENAGMSAQEFNNLSARDKAAFGIGLIQGQEARVNESQLKSSELQRLLGQEQLQGVRTQRRRSEEAEIDAAAFNAAVGGRLTMPEGQMGPQAPLTSEELLGIMARRNQLTPGVALDMVQQGERQRASGGEEATPKELVLGGNPFVFSPKSGVLMPNPRADAAPSIEPMTDEAGQVIGHAFRDPAGKTRFVPAKAAEGSAGVARYEEILGDLDREIAAEQGLRASKSKYATPGKLESLQERRRRVMAEYDSAFPNRAAEAKPAEAAKPAAGVAPQGGVRARWQNGKLIFDN